MKKKFFIVNSILFGLILVLDILYILFGGLWLKTITSLTFVAAGGVNLWCCLKTGVDKKFPIMLVVALFVAMLGDIIINLHFMAGAIIFAIGHVFYFVAYSYLCGFKWTDFVYAAAIFVPSLIIILTLPILKFDDSIMKIIVCIYALIISCMVGKALNNLLTTKSLSNIIILIGSVLFFISDFMLLLDVFGGLEIAGFFCLITYYPGQFLIAFAPFILAYKNSEEYKAKINQENHSKQHR